MAQLLSRLVRRHIKSPFNELRPDELTPYEESIWFTTIHSGVDLQIKP